MSDIDHEKTLAISEVYECLGRGDNDHACVKAQSLNAQFPNCYRIKNLHGYVSFRVGDFEMAERSLKESLDIEPRNPQALIHFSKLGLASGRATEALLLSECALAIDPTYLEATIARCLALASLDRREALEVFAKLEAQAPLSDELRMARARLRLRLGQQAKPDG